MLDEEIDLRLRLIILPLTPNGVDEKQEMIEKVIDLTDQIADTNQKIFILSGVTVKFSSS